MISQTWRVRINWKLALFTLAMLPLLLVLGFWQLDREQEKKTLQADFERRAQAPEVDLQLLDSGQMDQAFLRVKASGRFDMERSFLLDNRIQAGVVGYEVITPFVTEDGLTVMTNRGWVTQGGQRDSLPPIPAVLDTVEFRGSVYVPMGEQFRLGGEEEINEGTWPKVIQSLELEAMAEALESSRYFPYTVRLSPQSAGSLGTDWPLFNMQPEKHRAYAVQWFLMATVLLLLFVRASVSLQRKDPVMSDDGES